MSKRRPSNRSGATWWRPCAKGESQRAVARRYGFSLSTVQRWVTRAEGRRLDRVDWSDRPRGPRQSPTRTAREVENLILEVRRALKEQSDLGEFGAAAIHDELVARAVPRGPRRTHHRSESWDRRGVLDGRQRVRRKSPPVGWYLPPVAQRAAELDQVDTVEGLLIRDGPHVVVLNLISLHGALCAAWPNTAIKDLHGTGSLGGALARRSDCQGYVQFDNATDIPRALMAIPTRIGSVTSHVSELGGLCPVFCATLERGGFSGGPSRSFNGLLAGESLGALRA